MLKRLLLISLCMELINGSDFGYTQESVYDCNNESQYTIQEKREILSLYPIDKWFFVIFSPIAIFGSIFIIIKFIQDRSLFGMPGDILFILACSELLKNYQQFSSGIYAIIYDISPYPSGPFCQSNGIFSTITFIMINLYVLAFAGYPFALMYNALESTAKILRLITIIITCMILIPVITLSLVTHSISIKLNGLCAISPYDTASEYVIGIGYGITIICFITMSIGFILAFKKLVPKQQSMRTLRSQYLRYYQRFMIFCITIRVLLGLCSLINLLNCNTLLNPYINISITIENILLCIYSVGQVILISTDPLLRYKIYKFYYKNRQISNTNSGEDSSIKQEMTDINPLTQLHAQMKTTQVYSLLAGLQLLRKYRTLQDVICQYNDLGLEDMVSSTYRSSSSGEMNDLLDICSIQFSKEEVEECQMVEINDEILRTQLPTLPSMQCFNMKCVLYAPKIFNHFITLDQVDIEKSFDIIANQDRIKEFAGPDGGKSGEFFLFSHDNQLIIKTMRQSELQSLRKRLLPYSNYLNFNQDSLISKYYGLYTFERQELNKPKIHFIIMKNIALGVPKLFIKRIYDMKGSEHDREVLQQKDQQNQDLSKLTLKDIDFFKTEEQLWISKQKVIELSTALVKDSNFLMKLKFIDYSLLVMKIDWKAADLDIKKYITDSTINIVESNKEEGVYYHIAIIDYLQEWNYNKGMERATKKIIKMNNNLDTSAQEPEFYAKRFQEKLINRILPI